MTANKEEQQPPVVYGLGSVFSAPVLSITATTYVLLSMLLGDGLAPALCLQVVAMFFLLELHNAYMQSSSQG